MLISEDHFLPVPIKPQVTGALRRHRILLPGESLADDRRTTGETMTSFAQAREATTPARPETERLGIERRRFICLPDPDGLGHGHTVYPQHAAEKITEV